MTAERPDPLLGRPLTARERSALNALMHELDLCKAEREAHPILPPSRQERDADRIREAEARGRLAVLIGRGFLDPSTESSPLTEAERQALRAVRFRVDHGLRPSRYPASHLDDPAA